MTFNGLEELARDQARRGENQSRAVIGPPRFLRSLSVAELLQLEIPSREYLLEPILREKETAMIHAWRGVGKTYFRARDRLRCCVRGKYLGWSAPRPRPVLYLDGEMPARTMQERLAAIVRASPRAEHFDPANLQVLCSDLEDAPLPSLVTEEGRALVEPLVARADLVIVDSISTLAAGYGRENEAESWLPMQAWALELRRQGKAVVLLHHDGKGQQRGTSRKEDILDLVIGLRRPADYEPREGARFEVHFNKARGLNGDAVEPFEALFQVRDDAATWATRTLADIQLARAAALYRDGAKPADVQQGAVSLRATAYRLKAKAQEAGLLS